MRAILFLLVAGIASAQQNWQYVSYVGGAGDDSVSFVSSDGQGNTYIAGQTNSIGAPFEDGIAGFLSGPRGYLMKLDPAGQLVFSKVLGDGSVGAMIADAEGNVFVGGTLRFPPSDFGTAGAYQPVTDRASSFIAKFGPSGEKLFATYFGANNFVQIRTLAVDGNGQPVFCGTARGNFVPLTGNAVFQFPAAGVGFAFSSAYCAQLSADGSRLLFSTLLNGKDGIMTPTAAKVDVNGDLIVAGTTESAEIPLVNAFQSEDRRRTLFSSGADGRFRGIGGARFGSIVSQQQVGQEIFVGTQDAGAWASADGGETWEQVGDRGLSGVLAAHPLNTRLLCVANQDPQLVCSRDRGKSWVTVIGSRITVTGVVADPRVEGGFFVTSSSLLAVNYYSMGAEAPPNPTGAVEWVKVSADGSYILASVNGAGRSLQVSEDGGKTFRKIGENVRAAAASSDRRRLYASLFARRAGVDSVVIRSDDGGVSWANTALNAPFDVVDQLVVDPASPDTVYVVAGIGAFRSGDGGQSWQAWMPAGLDNVAVKSIQFDAQGGALVGALGLANGFVMKLRLAEPAVAWSTLFGGAGGAWLAGLSLDADGKIVLGGYTFGVDLPETGESLGPKEVQAGVVARLNADGGLAAVRYAGGAVRALDRSADGALQIAASATRVLAGGGAAEFGRFAGGTADAVWMTLSADLDRVLQVSWLGGSRFDQPNAIHAGSDGRIRMVGSTTSADLPVSGNPLQDRIAGGAASFFGGDGFLAITPLRF